MRFSSFAVSALLCAATGALASSASHWAALAAKSKDGVIKLDSASYDELLASDRDYSATVVLTALGPQFKCQPCHDFAPAYRLVSSSWRRKPARVRDSHFYAELDFVDGQAIYQRLGLSSAPTVQFHPALTGPNKANKLDVVSLDLNRVGLAVEPLHGWMQTMTQPFALHKPFNPVPFIVIPVVLLTFGAAAYSLRSVLIPLIQSRIIWGTASLVLILTFTSGYMWNKIKNAPYVAAGEGGKVAWYAGGFQNQLGMETQVVGAMYGILAFAIVALTAFVPAQTSPTKQRIGVYLWLALLIVVFSCLFKLFKFKNGGYPYGLLF